MSDPLDIPKTQFNVGDKVIVKVVEAGCQDFPAVVVGVRLDKAGDPDYTVRDKDGWESDGYTDSWLTAMPDEEEEPLKLFGNTLRKVKEALRGSNHCDTDQCDTNPHDADEHHKLAINPNNCAINEQTADGRTVGRCYYHLEDGKTCPRHGDVSKVQEHFRKTGKLTLEAAHRNGVV